MKRWLKIKLYVSGGLNAVGIVVLFFSFIPVYYDIYNKGLIYLPTLVQIAPGVSVGLALLAIGISFSSDVKMDINSNENFLRIVDRFEDMRIDMFQHNARQPPDYSKIFKTCWKCVTYMKRAIKLHEMANIDFENQKLLFDQVEQLIYFSEIPWGTPVIQADTYQHINNVCELCFELNLNVDQIAKLSELFGYIESFR